MQYKKVLTIAGSDSGGGAGIQADIKSISANGCYAMSVITALTAQNTVEVKSIFEVSPDFIADQIDAVLSDIGADAVKIGMLHRPEIIAEVAGKLKEYKVENIVLDPVMVAKSGDKLLREEAVDALKTELIPLARIITPNIPEAEVLAGHSITNIETIEKAGQDLMGSGCDSVLIKGGHSSGKESDDFLFFMEAGRFRKTTYPGIRVDSKNTHGTGCTLSSAIAAWIAKGYSVEDAVREGKKYIIAAIESGSKQNIGKGHGPVDHFYAYRNKNDE